MLWIKFPALALLLTVCACVRGEYMRVCYYPNWAQYRAGIMQFFPSNINPRLCTHIMYAFAKVVPDSNTLGPTENNDDGLGGHYKKVTDLKLTSPNLKVLLAIGGWTHASAGFTDVVSTDGRIDAFCDNVITYLRTRNFDGLDIDWEFPGQRGGSATDKQRYTVLLARLRKKFDAEAGSSNKLLLTASVSGSRQTIDKAYEISAIATSLDFVNIMAYDYQGSWSTGLDHASPLYARSNQQPPNSYTNADYTVKYWIAQGMPATKVVLGIPFYGKSFKLQSASKYKIGDPFEAVADDLPYYKVCSEDTPKPIYQFQYMWQTEQNASYAYDSVVWVGYETQKSIEIKANYIKDMKLGGAMVFELSQDDFNGQFCNQGRYPLLTKLKQVLQFSEDQCQAGSYVNATGYSCVDCPKDTYQDQVSQPACPSCPVNTQTKSTRSTGPYFCHTPCPAGQEFDTMDSTCKLCPMNYYKDTQLSSRVCIRCPPGQNTLTRGSKNCVPLTSGDVVAQPDRMTYTLTLRFTVSTCDRPELMTSALLGEARKQMLMLSEQWLGLCTSTCDNVVVDDSVTGCSTAGGRRKRQTSVTVEMKLIFNNLPQEVQQNTTAGSGVIRSTRFVLSDYFFDKTVFLPLKTTYGLSYNSVVSTKSTLVCTQPGYILVNALCEPCPVGTEEVSGSCVNCKLGFYQDLTGKTTCNACPQYRTTNVTAATSQSQCFVQCPAGTRRSGDTCIKCPVGQFQNQVDIAGCNECPAYFTTATTGSTSFSDCFLNCPAGMREDSGSTCVNCSVGQYQDQTRAKACKLCPQYKTTSAPGSTSAGQCFLQCPAGYRELSATCDPCPGGQYQDQMGSTTCKSCPSGQTTNVTGAVSAVQCFSISAVCPKGTKDVSGKCVACPLNYYQDLTGQSDCKPCQPNYITNSPGATSSSMCTLQCPAGSMHLGATCANCPRGQYQDVPGSSSCKACPQYKTTLTSGSTSLTDCILQCPVGMKDVSGTCVNCPVGEYQDQTGQTSCKACPVGEYQDQTGQTSCKACPAGEYQDQTGQTSCKACPAGEYQDQTGQTSCKACPAGTVTGSTGATSANQCSPKPIECPKGTKDISGTCVMCPLNYYQDLTGQSDCKPCQPNYITNSPGATSSSMCTLQCPAGSMHLGATCANCPRGQYQNEPGSSSCKACPQYKTTPTSGSTSLTACILQCPAGMKDVSGTCVKCPVGEYQDQTGQTSCKPCPAGTVTGSTGATSANQCSPKPIECPKGTKDVSGTCVMCPLNYYQDLTGQSDCKPCQPNYITNSPGTTSSSMCTLQCPAGSMHLGATCANCPRGQYQDQPGSSSCKACPQYKTTPTSGSTSLTACILQCPAGTMTQSKTCVPCPVGQYQDQMGKSQCNSCPQYKTTSATGSTSSTQCFLQCPVGFKAVSSSCVSCPVGQYQDETGASTCKTCPQFKTTTNTGATSVSQCVLQCPKGTKEEAGQCKKCPVGQYQDGVGATSCKNCPQHKTTGQVGSVFLSQCFLQCPAGFKAVSSSCVACPVGQYQDETGASTCKTCPQFKTTTNTGATSVSQCVLHCPKGTKEEAGQCKKCPLGQYQDGVGATSCKNCPQHKTTGQVGSVFLSQCFLWCPIGTHGNQPSDTCVPCPVGQYQDTPGSTSCKNCLQYRTTTSTGSTSSGQCFLQCPRGFTAQAGTCVQCPAGTYQDQIGSTSCKLCPLFKTTATTGATSSGRCFLQCPVGTKESSGTCQTCPLGQYQDSMGAKTCKDCPQFKTTAVPGAKSVAQCLLQCPAGYKVDSGVCKKCPEGQYQGKINATTCVNCPQFMTTRVIGSTSQSQCFFFCPVGRRLKSGTCVLCPVGQYQNTAGSTICKPCPEFRTTTSTGSTSQNQCVLHCPVGRRQVSGTCMKCLIGRYQNETGQTVCKQCGINKITLQTGSVSQNQCILRCPRGTKKVSDACVACPRGQYQDELDSSMCKVCPQWKTTISSGTNSLASCIWNCPQGMKEEGNACVACPIGQYQNEIGQKTCLACPIYRTTNKTGSTSPLDCVPECLEGWKGDRGKCVKCPLGQYQDLVGMTFCKACPKYRTTSTMGATSMMQCLLRCPVGMMESGGTCEDCPSGQYQDELSSTSCKQCPEYSTSTLTGLTSRDLCDLRCPVGYTNEAGVCVQCAVNYYQDTVGSTACTPCPKYKYTPSAGSTSVNQCILRCPAGTKETLGRCEKCPVDLYQDETGKTTCKNCPDAKRTNGTGASSVKHCLSPCKMSPTFCQNGGTCLWREDKVSDGMSCACRTRFYGDNCENYTEAADRLTELIGGVVGGSLAFLLILLAIVIACACWRKSPREKSLVRRNSLEVAEGVYNPYFYMDGKYIINQPAKIVELPEPTETSTDRSFRKSVNRSSVAASESVYTKATSFANSRENQASVMEVGNESDHGPGQDVGQYKYGLPYVGFINASDDEVGLGKMSGSPRMDGDGKYVRKIQV